MKDMISMKTNEFDNMYKQAFNILMDYFDNLNEEDREEINNRLNEIGL